MDSPNSNAKKDDMTMYLVGGGILLVLLLAFSYSNLNNTNGCSCHQHSFEQSDFKSMAETLFTVPIPVATPMPFVIQQSELVIPSIGGVVLQGGTNNYVRVAGTATTTTNGVGTSNNQIQIYNTGNLTASFDVDGLYVRALNVTGNTTIGGILDVTGNATLRGAVSITGGINSNSQYNYNGHDSGPPFGSINAYLGTTDPDGWVLCDGVQRTNGSDGRYNRLINAGIGTGTLNSTYTPPNLTGRFLYGSNGSRPLNQIGGAETYTLTTGNLPPHTHNGTTASTNVDHTHGYYKYAPSADTAGNPIIWGLAGGGLSVYSFRPDFPNSGNNNQPQNINGFNGTTNTMSSNTNHAHTFTTDGGSGLNSTPYNILPPFTCVNYIIKY